jgi:hypothetical protein
MSERHPVPPVKLFCGFIMSDVTLFAPATAALTQSFGAIDLQSDTIPFVFTDYYRAEMGDPLFRRFVAFETLVDPARLAAIKLTTNELETQFAGEQGGRRLNLDPGYVSMEKLVLATTKNYSHRIYLQLGIYAEVTLGFGKDGCRSFAWTYPDYQTEAYQAFFLQIRARLKHQLQA